MSLKDRLETDLYNAMRNKDETRKRTIRMAISGIKLVEIEQKKQLDDQSIISVLYKEVKIRKEKIEDAKKGNREEIIREAESEIAILQEFLPTMMDEQELLQLAKTVIQEVNAQGMKDMGTVMKVMMEKTKGQASNNAISRAVRGLLQQE
jgi:uncharacterized protein YqeY